MVFQSCVSATLCKFHLDGALPCPQRDQLHAFHQGDSNPLTPWWLWQGWAGQCLSNLYQQCGSATRYLLWGVVSLMCLIKELTTTCIYRHTHYTHANAHAHTCNFLRKKMFFCVLGFLLLCFHITRPGCHFPFGDMLCSSSTVLCVTDPAPQWVWACLESALSAQQACPSLSQHQRSCCLRGKQICPPCLLQTPL